MLAGRAPATRRAAAGRSAEPDAAARRVRRPARRCSSSTSRRSRPESRSGTRASCIAAAHVVRHPASAGHAAVRRARARVGRLRSAARSDSRARRTCCRRRAPRSPARGRRGSSRDASARATEAGSACSPRSRRGTMFSVWLNATETEVYAVALLHAVAMLVTARARGRAGRPHAHERWHAADGVSHRARSRRPPQRARGRAGGDRARGARAGCVGAARGWLLDRTLHLAGARSRRPAWGACSGR